ncbi:rho guanine nucleotide exchange factor 40 [Centropristis striata]|uniref:rho guanine nucleotide exchange factor 40 n=1 Tax=Centropristis striata TaxID=184440 RepID=UPI0027E07E0E|nr:rho guanine nucleotide exchange factor 40 [Centropristis striata]
MDSESLDRCIQSTLSALYPPFQATSPTVLVQVLSVVERCYRGDGLRYLFHFLLPAKTLLAELQHHACLQYCGLLFRHEGWPLCVHEKIVVQLCPLDQRLLRSGDFYLLVSPPAAAPPPRAHGGSCRSTAASSSSPSPAPVQQEVQQIALQSVFSMAWLDSVNREREQRGAPRLQRLLLSAHGDVFRVPWEDLVYPQFISRPRASLKEEELSVKDVESDSSAQEVKLLPSAASSEGEESEGEYVELTELPRFSPQKGSLTQSISLQHRARTSTHTPHNTPHNTHIPSAAAHTPQPALTHCSPCVEVSSRLREVKLDQDSCGPLILTPISPTSSSARPLVLGTSSLTSQEQTGGTDTGRSLELNTEHREEEQEERGRERETGGEREELIEGQGVVVEGEEAEGELEDSERRKNEELLSEGEKTEEESEEEEEDNELEEVEVEEEVQEVIIVQQSLERREEEVMKQDERGEEERGGERTYRDDCYSENTLQADREDSYSEITLQTQSEDSYSENTQQTHSESSYSENTLQTHPENPYLENNIQQTHAKDSYSENSTLQTHFKESNTQHKHSEDSYFEKTIQTDSEDSYSGRTLQTHPEDSYSENNSLQTHSESSYSENTLQTHPENPDLENNIQQTNAKDAYSENSTLQTHFKESNTQHKHSEDSYFENNTQQTHAKDSYSEKTLQTDSEDSYSEKTLQTHPEDSYSENSTLQTHFGESNKQHEHSKDSYFEKNKHTYTEESNMLQTLAEDSYSEKALQTHSKDSYSENPHKMQSNDSYFENDKQHSEEAKKLQTLSQGSYSENNTLQKYSEDSYSENNEQTHSYFEDTLQTHSKGSYSENNTPSDDSYFETNAPSVESNTAAMDLHSLCAETDKSKGEEEQEEKKEEEEEEEKHHHEEEEPEEEECSCEEVGGGRTANLQTEGLSRPRVDLSPGPSPSEPEPPASSPQPGPVRPSQSSQSSFFSVLLRSGTVCLPGTRDRGGRPLLTVCSSSSVWSDPDCDSSELLRLLLYYTSTLRKEVAALGLTVLVDARGAAPVPALFSALRSLLDNVPGSVHSVFLLVNKDSSLRPDRAAAKEVEVLSSLKSLQKHVELRQLPAEFGGSFSFSQSSWLCFRSRLEQLTNQCEDVIKLLQKTINILQSTPLPVAAQDAKQLLSRYQAVMCSILTDSRLVQLQQEGGASLSRLRREESVREERRAAVEIVASLYEQVDELLHRLVTLSNRRTQELTCILEFSQLEAGFNEVRVWLQEVGEVRLKSLEEAEDSLELLNKKQQQFKEFHTTAYEVCRRGEELLEEVQRWGDVLSADLQVIQVRVHSFWSQLQDFSQRVRTTGTNIQNALNLYSFLDQAYGWALAGMRQLAVVTMEDCSLPDRCQAVIGCLEEYQRQHPPIPDARFQEMKVAAGELRGERGLRQWSFAWSKCQETRRMLDRKMEAALRTRDSTHRQRSDSALSRSSASSRRTLSGLWGGHNEEDSPSSTPLLRRLFRSASSEESADPPCLDSSPLCSSSPLSSLSSSCRRQQLRKTQSFDSPPPPEAARYGGPRALSEPARRGNTGVFIRGLEVSSSQASDHTLCPRTPAHSRAGLCSPGTPRTSSSPAEPRPRGSKLRHVVEEMVTTEREYVRSLRYVLHHYVPEMERADLPQDLRGKRSVVFGNLEKLLDFHSQFFLRELEACWKHPLRVPHCFLRHQEQFSLYALYSKNKPKSDALLANHGNSFFRRKQAELGDKMDLSSYLLKPVQRMSKYALLLSDLIKEVGGAQEAELNALHEATNMVKFQLRHGNDLLAMDAIRDCDVNLKEQGQLIRQDEFTVWSGRRKCQRHIFLFEELVLFSKPRKMEGGLDVFIYKHSFKTADVGLTESAGDDGLRFEIWFRRRTSKNQTFILQAATADAKHAWTTAIARILWTQATRNKEMRLKEMVSMGVGNKPFLDIQPSDAAISDRAVHYIMKSRGARTRASIAVSVFDHSNPFKRGVVTSDSSASGPSSSSSCSLLGPLNLHMYSQNVSSSPAADGSFITSCIEEDEQEHETSSQPSMTTESSGSSSRCLSGSTGSDSGCVSAHLQEAGPEDPHPPRRPTPSSHTHLSSPYSSPTAAVVISPASIV